MTTTDLTVDVNQQFDANRVAQIASLQVTRDRYQQELKDFASGEAQARLDAEVQAKVDAGEIEMAGQGRYKVLTGWDANEYFTVQTARKPGELTMILPESGLDQVDGKTLGLFAQPEWHKLGIVKPGVTSISEAIGLAVDYDVLQQPVQYFANGELHTDPRSFVNYRSDTGMALGTVGKIYDPFQNVSAVAFLQELVDNDRVEIAAAAPLDGGRRMFVTVKLPDNIELNIPGMAEPDVILPYVAVINSHDGSTGIKAIVTPWRIRCGNTERLAVKGALTSWVTRHTENAADRVAEAQRQLALSVKYFDAFKGEEEALARVDLTTREVNKVIAELEAELWPLPEAVAEGSRKLTKREEGTRERRHTRIKSRFDAEAGEVGKSLFSVERAFTGDLDWGVPRKLRGAAMLEGADDGRKSQAHKLLVQRVR